MLSIAMQMWLINIKYAKKQKIINTTIQLIYLSNVHHIIVTHLSQRDATC